jgi:hypothetical protein
VRGTTRRDDQRANIAAAGAEAVLANPDRVATLVPALAQVALVYHALGSATGTDNQLQALHGSRLEMLLTKLIDTTVRGFVYEATGTVDAELLSAGAALVSEHCQRSRIPFALLDAEPEDADAAADALMKLLGG